MLFMSKNYLINTRILFIFKIIFVSLLSPNFLYGNSELTELKLTNKTVKSFYNYISLDRKPLDKFLVTVDGLNSFVWICPQTLCFPAGLSFYTKPCSKLYNNKKCIIFAKGRKIVLKKNINTNYELRKFEQGESLEETRSKLKKLDLVK